MTDIRSHHRSYLYLNLGGPGSGTATVKRARPRGDPLLTGAEIGAVAKAGRGVAAGLRGRQAQWPDAREALMELYVILDEWCEAAEVSNTIVSLAIDGQRPAVNRRLGQARTGGAERPLFYQSNIRSDYVRGVQRDSREVLDQQAHWTRRWRASARRRDGRRSLRNMLKLYCPDLLESFEKAVEQRADWVTANRDDLLAMLGAPTPPAPELRELSADLARTLAALRASREELGQLIKDTYPLGPMSSPA